MKKGLALKTSSIIESVSKMESIKPYLLTGGTFKEQIFQG